MTIMVIICLSLLYLVSISESVNYRIGSKCGFPGLPHDTKIEPEKNIYEDGEEISYRCPYDKIYLKAQVKKCDAGVWKGSRSTCGYFLRNQLDHVKIIKVKTEEVVFDGNTSSYTASNFPASFYDGKGTAVTITDAHLPHKWLFNFSNPMSFDFFLLNVRIPKSKPHTSQTINQIDGIRIKSVHIINEPERNCTTDFSTRDRAAKIFWFWCTVSKWKTPSDEPVSVSIITSAPQPIDIIGLHQVYFTKLQYCGQPQVPLLSQYVPSSERLERVQCDPKVAIEVDADRNSSNHYLEDESYMSCVDDEYWGGNPKCLPKTYCELDFREKSEEIVSVQNAYIFNETKWFAIEGTVVEYKCKNGLALIGNLKRTCLQNSTWDQNLSTCSQMIDNEPKKDSISATSGLVFPILISLIVVVLIVALIITVVIIVRRLSHNKRQIEQNMLGLQKYEHGYDEARDYCNEDYAEVNYEQNYMNGDRYEYNFSFPSNTTERDGKKEETEVNQPYYVTITPNINTIDEYLCMQKQG